jgi:hypothetical protein
MNIHRHPLNLQKALYHSGIFALDWLSRLSYKQPHIQPEPVPPPTDPKVPLLWEYLYRYFESWWTENPNAIATDQRFSFGQSLTRTVEEPSFQIALGIIIALGAVLLSKHKKVTKNIVVHVPPPSSPPPLKDNDYRYQIIQSQLKLA